MHGRGVFHRDIKPENVFLTGTDGGSLVAKLVDFGLSLAELAPAEARTSTGVTVGTPEYMAPERIAGSDGDLRSDVYALGVVLFELVTLRLPFVGEMRSIEYAHLSFRPPRPSRFAALPDALESVILRCLAKEPAERFPDAGALHAAFTDGFAGGGFERESPSMAGGQNTTLSSTRQQAALIFLHHARASAIDFQAVLQPFGGQLAHFSAASGVCAFTHNAGEHPAERALAAAEALQAAGLTSRLIVDVDVVTVKARSDGVPRISSPLFTQASRFPREVDPQAVLLTSAARETLPGLPGQSVPGRPDHFVLLRRTSGSPAEALPPITGEAAGLLFGRDQDLQALAAEAGRALADKRPRVATALAEQGLGKTRLLVELARRLRAEHPGAEVIHLSAREGTGQDADEGLAELLRRAFNLPMDLRPDRGYELLVEYLGERTEAAAAGLLLGWLAPDNPDVRSLRAAPGVLRANAARAGSEALRRLANRRPVMVLLDDAQRADAALLDALEQATVAELPLWVCAFARPEFANSRPSWGQRAAHAQVRRLGPLDRGSAVGLCRHLLEPVSHVPEPVLDRLVDRTEGIPVLIHGLIRELRREGLVREQAGKVWVVDTDVLDRLSDSPLTQWLASRELDELPAELAGHARLLSLLLPEIAADEVEGVLGAMDVDLLDAFPLDARVGTERLRQSGLLLGRGADRTAFRTEMMREAVARTVNEGLALRVHRAALAYYRAALLPDAARLPGLAWHAAAVGEKEQAAGAYLALAEAASDRHRYLEAELLYNRALAQLAESDQTGRLRALRGRGVMRYRLWRLEESLADLAQARELATARGDVATIADILVEEATALDWLFQYAQSRQRAEQARDLFRTGAPIALEARILLALGRSLNRFNEDLEAAKLLREAERLGRSLGDEGYEVRVIADLMLGFLLPFLGLTRESEERLSSVQALCEEKGDELHLAAMYQNRSCPLGLRERPRPVRGGQHQRAPACAPPRET